MEERRKNGWRIHTCMCMLVAMKMTQCKITNAVNLAYLKCLTPFWHFLGTRSLVPLGYLVLPHGPWLWDSPLRMTELHTFIDILLCLFV